MRYGRYAAAIIAAVILVSRPAAADVGHAWQRALAWRGGTRRVIVVTAYTSGPESTGKKPGDRGYGITASGTVAGYGTCAADPAVPFGVRLWIEGYGEAVVLDRGGAIRGNRLDVWFEKPEDARAWGVRRVRAVVIE